jgi:uncharacterized protein YjbI with pentapeptide repeats
MNKNISAIWQQFRQSLLRSGSPQTKSEPGQAILVAAKTLKVENASLEILQPVLQNSSTLLDVLCLPLTHLISTKLSFVSLGLSLLKFAHKINQKNLDLVDYVLIISQASYLESVQEILSLYPSVNWDANSQTTQLLIKIIQKLQSFELSDRIANNALICFHQSELATAFNQILFTRLTGANISKANAYILTQRIAWNTQLHITKACIELGIINQNFLSISDINWQQEQQKYSSIDEYLKTYIEPKPLERFFDEDFAFKDIYVPLKARIIKEIGKNTSELFDLETWIKGFILKQETLDRLIFIQGKSGRGKSFFCRMFADWIRQHLHPIWTPVLISLKDVKTHFYQLETILQTALKADFVHNYPNWLQDNNTRFLFILDGLDQLNTFKNKWDVEEFIQQLSVFQKKCQNSSEMGHRIILTGQPSALQYISQLPQNLERVEISEMDENLQEKWLQKWKSLPANQGKQTDLQSIIQKSQLPSTVHQLTQEPLILYLLAAMYRNEKLTVEKLTNLNSKTAKSVIYHEAFNWVLTKQNSQIDELTEQPEVLKHLLTEAAVCVIQSGGKFASLSTLEARLEEDAAAKNKLEKFKHKFRDSNEKIALKPFYIQPFNQEENIIEFSHQIFPEFLFAEQLKTHFKSWVQYYQTEDSKQLIVPNAQLNWQIYDLLGCGKLTAEIVNYLISLLIETPNFDWELLFRRLENFYLNWCQGKFIDIAEETLAQKKQRQLQKFGIKEIGQRQIDIYAGLNVIIILLELHRYGQEQDNLKRKLVFLSSGQRETENTLTNQLLKVINYSNCIEIETFNHILGQFLSGANLSKIDLRGTRLNFADFSFAFLGEISLIHAELQQTSFNHAYLSDANFSYSNLQAAKFQGANLNGANLSYANLSFANLSGAFLIDAKLIDTNFNHANLSYTNLTGAKLNSANLVETDLHHANLNLVNLRGADLSGANLSYTHLNRANLSGVDFNGANLSNADLRGANLHLVNFANANLENILWNEEMNFAQVQGWETAINLPASLKQYLEIN